MILAEDRQLIQALMTQRTDQAFGYAILPWQSGSDRPVADTHRPDRGAVARELLPEVALPIAMLSRP